VVDDRALIEAARAGSADAVSALYRRYWPTAWQWAYAVTGNRARADDLAQEAFMRAVDALADFDVERRFGPWLKRILVNLGIDELRRIHRVNWREADSEWMSDRRWTLATNDDVRPSDEVVEAVRRLAPSRRMVIVLHYWLDLAVDDIATLLGLPYGTVASRLSRALADLRVELEDEHVRLS
jgi:RNA polymerase sigma-70 factor, ECF subfamily